MATKKAKSLKNVLEFSSIAFKKSITLTRALMYQSKSLDFDRDKAEAVDVELNTHVTSLMEEHKKSENNGGNNQKAEEATLKNSNDYLHIHFGVKFVPYNLLTPYSCANDVLSQAYTNFMQDCVEQGLVRETVSLYIQSILAANFAHRNSDEIGEGGFSVTIKRPFTEFNFTVNDYEMGDKLDPEIENLIDEITTCITTKREDTAKKIKSISLQVVGNFHIGEGHSVYPSQLWVDADKSTAKISKHLAKLVTDKSDAHAYMTYQKVGNGIRHLDNFYSQATGKVIPVTVTGDDRSIAAYHRKPSSLEHDDSVKTIDDNFILKRYFRHMHRMTNDASVHAKKYVVLMSMFGHVSTESAKEDTDMAKAQKEREKAMDNQPTE